MDAEQFLKTVQDVLLNRPNIKEKVIGWNLKHDTRISENRKIQLKSDWNDSADIATNLDRHWKVSRNRKNPRGEREPDYLNAKLNSNNIYAPGYLPLPLSPSVQLVRLITLTGELVSRWIDIGKDWNLPGVIGLGFTKSISDPSGLRMLDESLGNLANSECEFSQHNLEEHQRRLRSNKLLNAIIDVQNQCLRNNERYKPVWASTWNSFVKQPDWDSPQNWLSSVGVSTENSDPTWVLMIKYPVSRTGCLVRPTQLDGGFYEWHFPTPHNSDRGLAMDCRGTRPHYTPLPEFLHDQIELEPQDLFGCVRVDSLNYEYPASGTPKSPQDRHLYLLKGYLKNLDAWIRTPHP